jgi:hypothetical protein
LSSSAAQRGFAGGRVGVHRLRPLRRELVLGDALLPVGLAVSGRGRDGGVELRQSLVPKASVAAQDAELHAGEGIFRIDRDRLTIDRHGGVPILVSDGVLGVLQELLDVPGLPLRLERDLHRAVEPVLGERFAQHARDHGARFFGVVGRLILVRKGLDGADVERDRRLRLAEDRGSGLAHAVAGPELVGDVEIEPADVGKREAGVFEVLEHVELDVAGKEILVGAPRLERAAFRQGDGLDRRHENLVVDLVEFHFPAADLLGAERHDHEADLAVIHGFLHSAKCRIASHGSFGRQVRRAPIRAPRAAEPEPQAAFRR